MGLALGPGLAKVFMLFLEESIVPTLQESMPILKKYVDDTFTVITVVLTDDLLRLNMVP